MAVQITDENIKDVLLKNKITLITFSAPWCGPCRMLAPIIDELHNDNDGITIGKVNIDENSETTSNYNVMGVPTLIFFKYGKEVDKIVGVTSKSAIQAKINVLK